jgi:hypothetical protein
MGQIAQRGGAGSSDVYSRACMKLQLYMLSTVRGQQYALAEAPDGLAGVVVAPRGVGGQQWAWQVSACWMLEASPWHVASSIASVGHSRAWSPPC